MNAFRRRELVRRLRSVSCKLGAHRWVVTKRSLQPVLACWYLVERCCWCNRTRAQFVPLRRFERRIVGLPVDGGTA